ncbi:uncharacterized protein V6R79_024294 [Siganus canaliculatus]
MEQYRPGVGPGMGQGMGPGVGPGVGPGIGPGMIPGVIPYPMSSTATSLGQRHSDIESSSRPLDWSANYKRSMGDDEKFCASSTSSNYTSSAERKIDAPAEREHDMVSIPGLGDCDFSAQDKPTAQTESIQPKYNSQSATNILMHFGLEKEDLEHLISYPEDQITPANLPFILRQIRIQKTKRTATAGQPKPSPEPQPNRSANAMDSHSLGGCGTAGIHQEQISSAIKPSKVIDYGHTGKYTGSIGEEIGQAYENRSSSSGSGNIVPLDSCGSSRPSRELLQNTATEVKSSALGSSCVQASTSLSSSYSSGLGSVVPSRKDQTIKQLQTQPAQTSQAVLNSFKLPEKDTDIRILKPEASKPAPSKETEAALQSILKAQPPSAHFRGVHPSRPGLVVISSNDNSGTKNQSNTQVKAQGSTVAGRMKTLQTQPPMKSLPIGQQVKQQLQNQPSGQQLNYQMPQQPMQQVSQTGQVTWPPGFSAVKSAPSGPTIPNVAVSSPSLRPPLFFPHPIINPAVPPPIPKLMELNKMIPQPCSQLPPKQPTISKGQPTPTMLHDYAAASPKVFPHTCSLCNKECPHMKDWICHQNTSLHLENCKQLRTRFPEWDGEIVRGPRDADRDAKPQSKQDSKVQKPGQRSSSPSRSSSPRRGQTSDDRRERRSRSRSPQTSRYARRDADRDAKLQPKRSHPALSHSSSPHRRPERRSRSRSPPTPRYPRRSRSRSRSPRPMSSRYRSRSKTPERRLSPRRRADRWSPQRRGNMRRSPPTMSRERQSPARWSRESRLSPTKRTHDSRLSPMRRSHERRSPARRSHERRSTPRRSRERRSTPRRSSVDDSPPQRKKISSAERLTKKILENSAVQSLSQQSDLQDMVNTLAGALLAELTKSKPSTSTAKKVPASKSTKGKSAAASSTKTNSAKASPLTLVKLQGISSKMSHNDVTAAVEKFGKTKSVVVFRSTGQANVKFENAQDAKKLKNSKSLTINGQTVEIIREKETVSKEPTKTSQKKPAGSTAAATSTPTKSTTAKSTTAKSTTAKSTTSKSTTANTTTAKSTTAKSTTVNTATAKSTTAKSTTAKSTPAKSITAKSTTAKSTAVKSTTAKSTTTKSAATVAGKKASLASAGKVMALKTAAKSLTTVRKSKVLVSKAKTLSTKQAARTLKMVKPAAKAAVKKVAVKKKLSSAPKSKAPEKPKAGQSASSASAEPVEDKDVVTQEAEKASTEQKPTTPAEKLSPEVQEKVEDAAEKSTASESCPSLDEAKTQEPETEAAVAQKKTPDADETAPSAPSELGPASAPEKSNTSENKPKEEVAPAANATPKSPESGNPLVVGGSQPQDSKTSENEAVVAEVKDVAPKEVSLEPKHQMDVVEVGGAAGTEPMEVQETGAEVEESMEVERCTDEDEKTKTVQAAPNPETSSDKPNEGSPLAEGPAETKPTTDQQRPEPDPTEPTEPTTETGPTQQQDPAGVPAEAAKDLAKPAAESTPQLTVGEMIQTRLDPNKIECLKLQTCVLAKFFYLDKKQLLLTKLPVYQDGSYTEEDIARMLKPFGFIYSDDNIYVIPQNGMAVVQMGSVKDLYELMKLAMAKKAPTLKGSRINYRVLGSPPGNVMSPLVFYKYLMKLVKSPELGFAERVVYIKKISQDEIRKVRDKLKKIGFVKNFLPLLNKVFVEFDSAYKVDHLGVWLSLLKRAPGYEVYRMKLPCDIPTALPPKCPEGALPDSEDAVAGATIPTFKPGIPPNSASPFWVTLKTTPFLFPTTSPWFIIPAFQTVIGTEDILAHASVSTIMLTGLPKCFYTQDDVTQLVKPYFPKQIPHLLYSHVIVLTLQRRAFLFFPNCTKCSSFAQDHIRKPVSIQGNRLGVHFVLDDMKPETSEELIYSNMMKWSNAGHPDLQTLKERLLCVETDGTSLDIVTMVIKDVASIADFVNFLPLANRILVEMIDPSGVKRVIEKYNTSSFFINTRIICIRSLNVHPSDQGQIKREGEKPPSESGSRAPAETSEGSTTSESVTCIVTSLEEKPEAKEPGAEVPVEVPAVAGAEGPGAEMPALVDSAVPEVKEEEQPASTSEDHGTTSTAPDGFMKLMDEDMFKAITSAVRQHRLSRARKSQGEKVEVQTPPSSSDASGFDEGNFNIEDFVTIDEVGEDAEEKHPERRRSTGTTRRDRSSSGRSSSSKSTKDWSSSKSVSPKKSTRSPSSSSSPVKSPSSRGQRLKSKPPSSASSRPEKVRSAAASVEASEGPVTQSDHTVSAEDTAAKTVESETEIESERASEMHPPPQGCEKDLSQSLETDLNVDTHKDRKEEEEKEKDAEQEDDLEYQILDSFDDQTDEHMDENQLPGPEEGQTGPQGNQVLDSVSDEVQAQLEDGREMETDTSLPDLDGVSPENQAAAGPEDDHLIQDAGSVKDVVNESGDPVDEDPETKKEESQVSPPEGEEDQMTTREKDEVLPPASSNTSKDIENPDHQILKVVLTDQDQYPKDSTKETEGEETFEILDSTEDQTTAEDGTKLQTPSAGEEPTEEEEDTFQVIDSLDDQPESRTDNKRKRTKKEETTPRRPSRRSSSTTFKSEDTEKSPKKQDSTVKRHQTRSKAKTTEEMVYKIVDSVEEELVPDVLERSTRRRSARGKKDPIPSKPQETSERVVEDEEATYKILDSVEDETPTRSTRGRRGRPSKKDAVKMEEDPGTRRKRSPAEESQETTVMEEEKPPKQNSPAEKSDAQREDPREELDSVEDQREDHQPASRGRGRRGRPRKVVRATKKDQTSKKDEDAEASGNVADEEEVTFQVLDSVEEDPTDDPPSTGGSERVSEDKQPEKSRSLEGSSRNQEEEEEEPMYQILDSVEDDPEENLHQTPASEEASTLRADPPAGGATVTAEESGGKVTVKEEELEPVLQDPAAAKESGSGNQDEKTDNDDGDASSAQKSAILNLEKVSSDEEEEEEEEEVKELVTLDEVGADEPGEETAPERRGSDKEQEEEEELQTLVTLDEITEEEEGKAEPSLDQEEAAKTLSTPGEAAIVEEEKSNEDRPEADSRSTKRKHDDDTEENVNFVTVDEVGGDEEDEEEEEVVTPRTKGRAKKKSRQTPVRKSTRGKRVSAAAAEEEEERQEVVLQASSSSSDPPSSLVSEQPDVQRQEAASEGNATNIQELQRAAGRSRAELKADSKQRRDEAVAEDQVKRSRSQSPSVANDFLLPPFRPDNPLGQEFVVPKMGFFCNLCNIFYLSESVARERHCSSQKHYDNLQKHYEKLQQRRSRASTKSPPLSD